MKNNRGFSLMEIIISIALISLVMMFMFRLLLLVRSEDNLTQENANLNVVASLIISEIQDDIFTKEIKYVYKPVQINGVGENNECYCSFGYTDCLLFYYKTGEIKELGIFKTVNFNDSIKYGDVVKTLPKNYSFLYYQAYPMSNNDKFGVDEIGRGQYLSVPSTVIGYDVDSLMVIQIPIYHSNTESTSIEIRSTYSCQYIKDELSITDCALMRPTCPTP